MTDPKEIKEAIEKVKIVMQDISIVWRGKAGLEEELYSLQTLIQTAEEYLKLRERINVERIEKVIFQDMHPVLCEKTQKGEWILPAPIKLAQAIKDMLEET